MAHIHEKIDFIVDVFIVNNNRVLIRKHEKYHQWLAVGGHIELDETPEEVAVREVKEEVGLDIKLISPRSLFNSNSDEDKYRELIPPWYSNIHKINENHKHISLVYFATSDSDLVVPQFQEDISNEWKWFTKEELNKNEQGISAEIIFYAKQALKELGEE